MSKPTPGPWRYTTILTASENHRGWNITRDHTGRGGFVGTVSPRIIDDSGDSSAEGLANARLIAKAPDMHDLLSELADYLDVPESAAGGDDTARAYCKRIRELLS